MSDLTAIVAAHWLRNSITDDMDHDDNDWSTYCQCGHRIADSTAVDVEALHRAHLAAALRESRTVRTVEELDALPHLSLVRELGKYGAVWERRDETVCSHRWEQIAGDALSRYPRIPARVLYVPDEDGALS